MQIRWTDDGKILKQCSKCRKFKRPQEFYRRSEGGRLSQCMECDRKRRTKARRGTKHATD